MQMLRKPNFLPAGGGATAGMANLLLHSSSSIACDVMCFLPASGVGRWSVSRPSREKKLENKVSVKVTTRRCTSIRVTLVGYTFSKLVIARIVKLLLFSLNRFDG